MATLGAPGSARFRVFLLLLLWIRVKSCVYRLTTQRLFVVAVGCQARE